MNFEEEILKVYKFGYDMSIEEKAWAYITLADCKRIHQQWKEELIKIIEEKFDIRRKRLAEWGFGGTPIKDEIINLLKEF